jgi:hypothetical protein
MPRAARPPSSGKAGIKLMTTSHALKATAKSRLKLSTGVTWAFQPR